MRAFRIILVIIVKREGVGRFRGWRSRRNRSGYNIGGIFTGISILVYELYVIPSSLHLGLKYSPIDRKEGSNILIIAKLTVSIGRDLLKVER